MNKVDDKNQIPLLQIQLSSPNNTVSVKINDGSFITDREFSGYIRLCKEGPRYGRESSWLLPKDLSIDIVDWETGQSVSDFFKRAIDGISKWVGGDDTESFSYTTYHDDYQASLTLVNWGSNAAADNGSDSTSAILDPQIPSNIGTIEEMANGASKIWQLDIFKGKDIARYLGVYGEYTLVRIGELYHSMVNGAIYSANKPVCVDSLTNEVSGGHLIPVTDPKERFEILYQLLIKKIPFVEQIPTTQWTDTVLAVGCISGESDS